MTIQQLDGPPLILPSPSHGLRGAVDLAFAGAGLQPRVVAEIDSLAGCVAGLRL